MVTPPISRKKSKVGMYSAFASEDTPNQNCAKINLCFYWNKLSQDPIDLLGGNKKQAPFMTISVI